MVNGPDPVRITQVIALIVRDGNERELRKDSVKGGKVRRIESTVYGRHCAVGNSMNKRSVYEFDMEVQNIELVRSLSNLLQHDDMVWQRILCRRIEAKRQIAARYQLRGSFRISTGKQRHVMSLPNQFFGKVGNDAFSASI